jgi:hypothetical protein
MNCDDAREMLAAFTSRTIGLTERALIEAHLRGCGACRDLSRPPALAGRPRVPGDVATRVRVRDLGGRLRRRLPFPLARVAWLALLATAALYALHARPGPEPDARREPVQAVALAPPPAQPDVESPAPAAIDPGESPTPEIGRSAESEPGGPRESDRGAPPESPAPRLTSLQPPEPRRPESVKLPRAAPPRVEAASPEPVQRRVPPMAHVAGRLSVKDRTVIERDLIALLQRAGGTLVGTGQDGAILFVDAVVPQSGYEEFTRGLTRIGSWRIEAERSPLPEDVHLTIRVGG